MYDCCFIVAGILNPRIGDMLHICLGTFLAVLQVGGCMHNSPFTHTHFIIAYHEWGPKPGSE